MNRQPKIDIRGTYRSHSPVFQDTRQGLGYGLAVPSGRFDVRPMQGTFPYRDVNQFEEELEDEEFDELDDIDHKILSKLNKNVFATDSFAAAGSDPFYYVAGNTKLAENIPVAKNSIVPIPGMYKRGTTGPAVGGFGTDVAYTTAPHKKTGTKQGYFSPPPPVAIPMGYELVTFNLRDMIDNDELAIAKFEALRDYIDMLARETK